MSKTVSNDIYLTKSITNETLYKTIEQDVQDAINATPTTDMSDGTASLPGLPFTNDLNTGIYRKGADNLGISTGGGLRMDVSDSAITSTVPYMGPDGDVSNPTFAQALDPAIGMYFDPFPAQAINFTIDGDRMLKIGNQQITVEAKTFSFPTSGVINNGGNESITFSSSSIDLKTDAISRLLVNSTATTISNKLLLPNALVSAPSFSFTNSPTTGMYASANDNIDFSIAGVNVANLDATDFTSTNGISATSGYIRAPDGTLAIPSISFNNDPDTGIANIGGDNLGFVINTAEMLNISSSRCEVYNKFYVPNGILSAPTYSFTNSPTSGLYLSDTDTIGVSALGNLVMEIDTNETVINNELWLKDTFRLNAVSVTTTPYTVSLGDTFITLNSSANVINLTANEVGKIMYIYNNTSTPATINAFDEANGDDSFVSQGASGADISNTCILEARNGMCLMMVDTGRIMVFYSCGFDGKQKFPVGSASAPSIYFHGDIDTGLYWDSSGAIGATCNGFQTLKLEQASTELISTELKHKPLTVLSTTVDFAVQVGDGISAYQDVLRVDESKITCSAPPVLPGYTIAGLPTPTTGMMAYVTNDATHANAVVSYNGSAWVKLIDGNAPST